MNIVFLGMPGSGKGTQAVLLAKELKIPAISTGEILRKEITLQSKVGQLAKSYVDKGSLVPDDVMVKIVEGRIGQEDCSNGFILDGFPRNLEQANLLSGMLLKLNKKIELVFDFKVDEEILIKRISGRFSCKGCGAIYNLYFNPTKDGICDSCGSSEFSSRSDDNEVVVKNRLDVHNKSSIGLDGYYKNNAVFFSINAAKDVALIFEEVISKVRGTL